MSERSDRSDRFDGVEPRPPHAVALRYRRGSDRAPRVVAAGRAGLARAILERARRHGVPVERDPDLLECLAPLRVGAEIPPEAYVAVAGILAFLYGLNKGA